MGVPILDFLTWVRQHQIDSKTIVYFITPPDGEQYIACPLKVIKTDRGVKVDARSGKQVMQDLLSGYCTRSLPLYDLLLMTVFGCDFSTIREMFVELNHRDLQDSFCMQDFSDIISRGIDAGILFPCEFNGVAVLKFVCEDPVKLLQFSFEELECMAESFNEINSLADLKLCIKER